VKSSADRRRLQGLGESEDDLRLDEEKLETLRRWGEGLTRDPREEVAASGRAIVLLIDEVERLHVDLWNATRLFPDTAADSPEELPDETPPVLEETLLGRVTRRLRRERPADFSHDRQQPVEKAPEPDATGEDVRRAYLAHEVPLESDD
jgi:hypothetical protein